jgi:2-iminobutanoate/2-iminopropanoate deaminase
VALEYLAKVLEAAGTTLANVVKVNVYLANFDRDFTSMNQVYTQVGF